MAARREREQVPLARKGRGASATGPEPIRRRDTTGAARRPCRATGGIPTKPCKPHSRMDGASRREENRRWRSGEVPRTAARKRATVAENAPAAERPLRRRRAPKRTPPKAIFRLSSVAGRDGARRLRKGKHGWGVLRHTMTGKPRRQGKRSWRVLRHTLTGKPSRQCRPQRLNFSTSQPGI